MRTRGQVAPTHAFQACLLNHCRTSPDILCIDETAYIFVYFDDLCSIDIKP